jgi:hypothetical protein
MPRSAASVAMTVRRIAQRERASSAPLCRPMSEFDPSEPALVHDRRRDRMLPVALQMGGGRPGIARNPLSGWAVVPAGMAKLDTAAVATLLREIAQRMELAGGNPDRARAYGRAAENLALSPWHEIAHRRNMSRRSISHQRPDWLIVFCQHC